MTPFLKWVGGKRWLVCSGHLHVPKRINRYIEPFLGGGAVFFALEPPSSILSDLNERLVETYCALRDRPQCLQAIISLHASKHCDDYYYDLRSREIADPIERAAQFLYLNRTCFNGIYRENLSGQFNVPKGTKNAVLLTDDDFEAWSKILDGAEITASDFEVSIGRAGPGDLVFVDPPYTVKRSNNVFLEYNRKIFSWDDQLRLAVALKAAVDRGASFVLTNADHESILKLYEDFADVRSISRNCFVAASSEKRGMTTELLVSSFSREEGQEVRSISNDTFNPETESSFPALVRQSAPLETC